MGKVIMEQIESDSYIYVSWAFRYEYTYCDRCGSFNIGFSSITGLIAHQLLGKVIGPLFCRKCGNKNITSDNPLNFTSESQNLMDVPEYRTLKIHIETKEL